MERLALGKIPVKILNDTVLRLTGADSDMLVTPAEAGVDFAALKTENGFLVVSADPITGVSKDVGTYAVKVSANDVATSGNRPQFAESVVLLPEGSTTADLRAVARQIHEAAKGLGIAILGGHTEVTPGLGHPIVVVTVFSLVKGFVTSAGAKAGDSIMMTKTAGLEGTAELASEGSFPEGGPPAGVIVRARRLRGQISVVPEAVAAYKTGHVHAMHDCTEGGVLGAVFEMSLASGLGFVVEEGLIPVLPETAQICEGLSADPLKLIGSGALLLAVRKGKEAEVKRALRGVCRVTRIGTFVEGARSIVCRDGSRKVMTEAPQDELWRVLGRGLRRG